MARTIRARASAPYTAFAAPDLIGHYVADHRTTRFCAMWTRNDAAVRLAGDAGLRPRSPIAERSTASAVVGEFMSPEVPNGSVELTFVRAYSKGREQAAGAWGATVRRGNSLRPISRISSAMLEGVYLDPDERKRHLKAVRAIRPQRDHVFEHDYLYGCLTILDAKAQALLAYDGILMAAAAISLSLFSHGVSPGSVAVFSSLAASSLSSVLCLAVIWIYWTDTVELENSGDLFDTLLRVRNRRTLAYRLSWVIAQASALLMIVGVVLAR